MVGILQFLLIDSSDDILVHKYSPLVTRELMQGDIYPIFIHLTLLLTNQIVQKLNDKILNLILFEK